jgi:nicotinate-nucleotide adenylyltransferase
MRIGILGGSFDPPHLGHLGIASAALDQLSLDEIIFVPAAKNPLKARKLEATALQRLEMLRLLIGKSERMAVSDLEMNRKGESYTIDTLDELSAVFAAQFWLILGSDAALRFPDWRQYKRILKQARLAVIPRETQSRASVLAALPAEVIDRVDFLDHFAAISSTQIRTLIKSKLPVHTLTGTDIARYIEKQRLYGADSN